MADFHIDKNKIVLVEGKDEINFINALLDKLSINNIQIIELQGRGNLKKTLSTLFKLPENKLIQSLAIVIDADNDQSNEFKSVQDVLKNNNLPVPGVLKEFVNSDSRRVGVYILPGNADSGMLEDLCLATVDDHPVMSCLNQYITCLKASLPIKLENEPTDSQKFFFPKNQHKAKAMAFLAAMYEPCSSVGVAAQKGYWNIDHPSLDEFKQFLLNI